MSYLPTCTFPGDRADALIDYLYGERGSPTALAFADHLAACQVCRAEVGELGEVRQALDEWSPPEPFRALTLDVPSPQRLVEFPQRTPPSAFTPARSDSDALSSHRLLPAWARAAAAVACVGIGLGA